MEWWLLLLAVVETVSQSKVASDVGGENNLTCRHRCWSLHATAVLMQHLLSEFESGISGSHGAVALIFFFAFVP